MWKWGIKKHFEMVRWMDDPINNGELVAFDVSQGDLLTKCFQV